MSEETQRSPVQLIAAFFGSYGLCVVLLLFLFFIRTIINWMGYKLRNGSFFSGFHKFRYRLIDLIIDSPLW